MTPRKPKTALEDRLRKLADEARGAAVNAGPGCKRDDLVKKARKAEAIAKANE